ncbi:hypothetical protein H1C71_011627, partial [Ictidomys tridecemlineatus]
HLWLSSGRNRGWGMQGPSSGKPRPWRMGWGRLTGPKCEDRGPSSTRRGTPIPAISVAVAILILFPSPPLRVTGPSWRGPPVDRVGFPPLKFLPKRSWHAAAGPKCGLGARPRPEPQEVGGESRCRRTRSLTRF